MNKLPVFLLLIATASVSVHAAENRLENQLRSDMERFIRILFPAEKLTSKDIAEMLKNGMSTARHQTPTLFNDDPKSEVPSGEKITQMRDEYFRLCDGKIGDGLLAFYHKLSQEKELNPEQKILYYRLLTVGIGLRERRKGASDEKAK